jgi:hypothetical protein
VAQPSLHGQEFLGGSDICKQQIIQSRVSHLGPGGFYHAEQLHVALYPAYADGKRAAGFETQPLSSRLTDCNGPWHCDQITYIDAAVGVRSQRFPVITERGFRKGIYAQQLKRLAWQGRQGNMALDHRCEWTHVFSHPQPHIQRLIEPLRAADNAMGGLAHHGLG